jgi:hypothetical protein
MSATAARVADYTLWLEPSNEVPPFARGAWVRDVYEDGTQMDVDEAFLRIRGAVFQIAGTSTTSNAIGSVAVFRNVARDGAVFGLALAADGNRVEEVLWGPTGWFRGYLGWTYRRRELCAKNPAPPPQPSSPSPSSPPPHDAAAAAPKVRITVEFLDFNTRASFLLDRREFAAETVCDLMHRMIAAHAFGSRDVGGDTFAFALLHRDAVINTAALARRRLVDVVAPWRVAPSQCVTLFAVASEPNPTQSSARFGNLRRDES